MSTEAIADSEAAAGILPASEPRGAIRRLWLLPMAVLLLLVSLLIDFPFEPWDGRFWGAMFNLAHAPVFCGVFIFIVGVIDPKTVGWTSLATPLCRLTPARLLWLVVALSLLGIVAELAQTLVDRGASLTDVAANTGGIVAGFCWCIRRSMRRHAVRMLLPVICLAMVIIPGILPGLELREYYRQRQEFPLLASFERPLEITAWHIRRSAAVRTTEWATDGRFSLCVTPRFEKKWPGLSQIWPVPDWSAYRELKFDVRNPQDVEIKLGIVIGDEAHSDSGYKMSDRFQTSVMIPPEATQTVTIQLSDVASAPDLRNQNLKEIVLLNIFFEEKQEDVRLLFDNLRLTK